jgi:hypothetical protein
MELRGLGSGVKIWVTAAGVWHRAGLIAGLQALPRCHGGSHYVLSATSVYGRGL